MSEQTWISGLDRPAGRRPVRTWAAYDPGDLLRRMWREKWLMLGVFLLVLALGTAAAFSMKKTYTASSSILVRLGQEYVYQPSLGDAARGAISTTDQMVQSELEILTSTELRLRVIAALGLGRIFPEMAEPYARATPAEKQRILSAAALRFRTDMGIGTAPDATVIRVSFRSADPQRAALVLNKLIDEYMVYRRTVLIPPQGGYLDEQRHTFEQELARIDENYQDFLQTNQITDFDADRTSLNGLLTSLTDESYRVQARLREIDGRLGEINRATGQLPSEIPLTRDTDPAKSVKLNQLRVERQDLLARYLPTSQAVRDKEAQIAEMEALIARTGPQGEGPRRYGVNPVRQTAENEQVQLRAESAALTQRRAALSGQIGEVAARRQRLNQVEPRYRDLTRDREVLQTNIRGLVEKEQQDQAQAAIARKSNDNIRIVERAMPPAKGKSLRKIMLLGSVGFAGLCALFAGLIAAYMRGGAALVPLGRTGAFPPARSAGLPVLATVGFKG